MTDPPHGAIGLVAAAISYALGACASLTPEEMSQPTPCTQWDLRTLLAHLGESMADLEAGLRTGQLGLEPRNPGDRTAPPETAPGDPVEILRDRAAELLYATYCSGTPGQFVTVGALPVPAGVVVCTGAVEIAVHGWDVAAARGCYGPIPASLATRLLRLCPLLIAGREGLFADPVEVPGQASPGDKLVGFLGRSPEHPRPAERWLLVSSIGASSLPDGSKGG
jgi:uncharacterized protein (TIGR03086 family)